MNAQNPSAEWVMLFKYPIITEAISKDGSGFAAVTKSEEGTNGSILIHLISSQRQIIFKKLITFDGDMFKAQNIFIQDNAQLIALTGYISTWDMPELEIPLTLILDNSGKELWRTNSEMLGLLSGGNNVLLNRNNRVENAEPCFRDEKKSVDYDCLRIVDTLTGELRELITFQGHLGVFGFVEIWDENHIAIGTQEGEIFFKDVEDNTKWNKRSEGLIVKVKIDKTHDMLVVERGLKDAVYNKAGKELWNGIFRKKSKKSEFPIDYDIAIQFGVELFDKTEVLFWNKGMNFKGMYEVGKDEINMLFHWETFGEKFMRYSHVHYSENEKRAIARTLDGIKLDYFNFEFKSDPATANEP